MKFTNCSKNGNKTIKLFVWRKMVPEPAPPNYDVPRDDIEIAKRDLVKIERRYNRLAEKGHWRYLGNIGDDWIPGLEDLVKKYEESFRDLKKGSAEEINLLGRAEFDIEGAIETYNDYLTRRPYTRPEIPKTTTEIISFTTVDLLRNRLEILRVSTNPELKKTERLRLKQIMLLETENEIISAKSDLIARKYFPDRNDPEFSYHYYEASKLLEQVTKILDGYDKMITILGKSPLAKTKKAEANALARKVISNLELATEEELAKLTAKEEPECKKAILSAWKDVWSKKVKLERRLG